MRHLGKIQAPAGLIARSNGELMRASLLFGQDAQIPQLRTRQKLYMVRALQHPVPLSLQGYLELSHIPGNVVTGFLDLSTLEDHREAQWKCVQARRNCKWRSRALLEKAELASSNRLRVRT